jgi:hypothetical protein
VLLPLPEKGWQTHPDNPSPPTGPGTVRSLGTQWWASSSGEALRIRWTRMPLQKAGLATHAKDLYTRLVAYARPAALVPG